MQQGPWARKAARRRTGLHTLMAVVFLALAAGAGYLVIVQVPKWLKGPDVAAPATPSPSVSTLDPIPGCQSPGFPDFRSLGTVAWVQSGQLDVVDLPTCRQKTLVPTGADQPVRFSPDGQWIAYGALSYVKASGGKATRVDDATHTWAWSPAGDRVAYVNRDGAVDVVQPRGKPKLVFSPGNGRVGHVAWSPDGTKLAVDMQDRIVVVDLHNFIAKTVFSTSGPGPEVAVWTPDSKWVLFWAKPLGQSAGRVAGRALNVVPAGGGDWRNVFESMLPYQDFLGDCGGDLALTGGGKALVSEGKQILVTGPPDWSFHNVTQDYLRSWLWPACSPDAKWMAVVSTANRAESSFGGSVRPLWLLKLGTTKRTRVDPPEFGAYETPRWAPDGRTVLVVFRKENDWNSPGSLTLMEFDPATGKNLQVADLGIDIGSAPGA
ncbi:MAG TPA: hypothetical protein VNN79_11350, partial [Actinomycetota bacterium]|nr:hypothetical protein [Actinomycetota bacterium]